MIRIVSVTHHLNGSSDHKGCRVYWAIEGMEVLGICHVQPHRKPIEISDLIVDPAFRLKGIGRMIVNKIRNDYKGNNYCGQSAPSAVPFWKEMGAKIGYANLFVIEK